MDAFMGKWKLVPELTEGFEQFLEAMNVPEELRQKMRGRKNVTVETARDGDKFTSVVDYGDSQTTTSFKLDEWRTDTNDGVEVKSYFKFEGGKLFGEHEVRGKKSTSVRYVVDDQIITENTGNGKTMKTVYKRV